MVRLVPRGLDSKMTEKNHTKYEGSQQPLYCATFVCLHYKTSSFKKEMSLCRFTWREETISKLPACSFVSATTSASSPHVSHAWSTSSVLNTLKLTRGVLVCRCGSHSHLGSYWMSACRLEKVRLWLCGHADATRVPQRHHAVLQEEDWKYSQVRLPLFCLQC